VHVRFCRGRRKRRCRFPKSPGQSLHVVMRAHHIGSYVPIVSEGSTGNRNDVGRYEIRLNGHLASRWAAWFDGLSLTNESDGTTLIHGLVVDQAALHGLLQRVRDIGLPLISVTRVESEQPDVPTDRASITTSKGRTT
jgi:hypothetical protein